MKFVLNAGWGGFGVSDTAAKMLNLEDPWDADDMARNDPRLIEVVETLGEIANANYAELIVVEIPDNSTDWEISEYDGAESISYVVDGKIYQV